MKKRRLGSGRSARCSTEPADDAEGASPRISPVHSDLAGFLYLAVVVDAWSRRVVGWAMATHLRTALVLEALNMALKRRRPAAVIHHSDQGTLGEFNWSSQHLEMDVL